MNNLREVFKKYAAVVFFDTETTGTDAATCQIIELAAIRIEQPEDGVFLAANLTDMFVKLPEGQKIPEKIVSLTGITDVMLETEGAIEEEVAATFADFINPENGPVLMVAHNAQFDLHFVREMLKRNPLYFPADDGKNMNISRVRLEWLEVADYLDTLTVYKDRRPYPHRLENAIRAYNLQDKVENSHRAIDDVEALFEVCKAMDNERADLLSYVNVFGYNPKYGISEPRIKGVSYWPQRFNNGMQPPTQTLPERAKNGRY